MILIKIKTSLIFIKTLYLIQGCKYLRSGPAQVHGPVRSGPDRTGLDRRSKFAPGPPGPKKFFRQEIVLKILPQK